MDASVELRRGPEASGEVRAWFAAFDRLLEAFRSSTERLGRDAYRPTVGTAGAALADAETMARAYREMTGDDSGEETVAGIRKAVGPSGPPSDPLPKAAFEAVYSIEEDGLLRWLHLLQQGALEAPGPRGVIPVNALVSVRSGSRSLELAALDVSSRRGRELQALARCVAGLAPGPELAPAVLGSSRLWLRLGAADFFADLRPPHEGGLVRVRYRERGAFSRDRARFYFLTRVLYELGFSVRAQGRELHALLGAGRSRASAADVEEALVASFRAAAAAHRMSRQLEAYLADARSRKENVARLDYLARVFLAEGELPFLDPAKPDSLKAGVAAYREREAEREAERARMDKVLSSFGLGTFPAGLGVGRRTVALHYDAVLAAAAARGEVVLSKGRVSKGPSAPRVPSRQELPAGGGPPFTARVTYDRSRAMMGGRAYATPFVVPADAAALKRSRALVTTSGGALARSMAARAGIPAFELEDGRWTGAGIEAFDFQARRPRVLREGEAVRLEPARGRLSFLPPESQEMLAGLEEALTAYDRGADAAALAIWASAQMRLTPRARRKAFAEALIESLKRRSAPAAHLAGVERALKEGADSL